MRAGKSAPHDVQVSTHPCMCPSTNGRLFSGASRPSTKTFSHSGQVAHSARATAWRTSTGISASSRSIARVQIEITAGKLFCIGKQYARVRVRRWGVNYLKVVQLWIARKTREEHPPAPVSATTSRPGHRISAEKNHLCSRSGAVARSQPAARSGNRAWRGARSTPNRKAV